MCIMILRLEREEINRLIEDIEKMEGVGKVNFS